MSLLYPPRQIRKILNTKIAFLHPQPSNTTTTPPTPEDSQKRYNITLTNALISAIQPHLSPCSVTAAPDHGDDDDTSAIIDASKAGEAGDLMVAPGLCHAHVHIDKCFLFSDGKYADLKVERGGFEEALGLTARAKVRFEGEDLIRRGRWLIEESVAAGVTHMRVFVEVDVIVQFKCLSAATKLKELYKDHCHLQICVFAQDPIFSTEHGEENRSLLLSALQDPSVKVLGTTPYVETNDIAIASNIDWAVTTALKHEKHLDLHLDYNLSPTQKSWIPAVINSAKMTAWNQSHPEKSNKTIALGHCTRMTLYDAEELSLLATSTKDLPLHFIGLPTSDMYMMGRSESKSDDRARGTLQIPHLISEYSFRGAISINNVGNAFTPYGNCDPLSLASLGVGLYQAGSKADARLLYECVSTRARNAIGEGFEDGGEPIQVGRPADLVLFGTGDGDDADAVESRRPRGSLQEIVYDPPRKRRTIYRGCLISE